MHVVFFSRRAWPAVGGVERHLQFLCEALLRQDSTLKISVITEALTAESEQKQLHEGVTYYRFPMLPNVEHPDVKKSVARGVRQFLDVIKSADVIHVHDVFFWLLPIFPYVFHKKIFITFHGYEPPGPPSWRQRFWHQLAEILSDGNICIGGFHQKWYGVEPTVTSFGAVGVDEKNDVITTKKSANTKIIFVGRLENDTGIWAYLEALAQAKTESNFQFSLSVFGDGALRKSLEFFAKDHEMEVKFFGQKTITVEAYRNFDLSLGAGYLGVLESLAAGVPVIATYVSELKKDYLQDSPFNQWITVAAPGKELVRALQKNHVLAAATQAWAEQQSWKKLADQYITLWTSHD